MPKIDKSGKVRWHIVLKNMKVNGNKKQQYQKTNAVEGGSR